MIKARKTSAKAIEITMRETNFFFARLSRVLFGISTTVYKRKVLFVDMSENKEEEEEDCAYEL